MATIELEAALVEALPDGFETTLIEEDRLRQLENADTSNLQDTIDDYSAGGSNFTLNEQELIVSEIEKVLTSYLTDDRALELPGLAIEFDRILQFAAYYKADNDTPSGTIKNPARAGPDDIVFSFANPEVYQEITGNTQDSFVVEGVSAGDTVELVGDAGLHEAGNSNGDSITLDDDEMLFYTGDVVDLSGGQSILSKYQWTDIDGDDYGAHDAVLQNRLSNAHIATTQGAWGKSTLDLDAKAYAAGNAEPVPVAFYMAPGTKTPDLV